MVIDCSRLVPEHNVNHNRPIPVLFAHNSKSIRTMRDHRNCTSRANRIIGQVEHRIIHANDDVRAGSARLAGLRRSIRRTNVHRNFVHLRYAGCRTLELQDKERVGAPHKDPQCNLVDSWKRGPPGRGIWSAHEINLSGMAAGGRTLRAQKDSPGSQGLWRSVLNPIAWSGDPGSHAPAARRRGEWSEITERLITETEIKPFKIVKRLEF